MLLLKLLQQLIRTLNSDGTPGQVAAGIALGAALGLTPLLNVHNLVIFALAVMFQVSMPGFMLGWVLFVPFGFVLDPVFDRVGQSLLLGIAGLQPVWVNAYNSVAVLTNFNNTVVIGSLVSWLVLSLPIYLVFRIAVARYRQHVYERLKKTKMFQAVKASKVYNFYRLFQPPT
jgi:uncharacterized protein (TIGR03546 family)